MHSAPEAFLSRVASRVIDVAVIGNVDYTTAWRIGAKSDIGQLFQLGYLFLSYYQLIQLYIQHVCLILMRDRLDSSHICLHEAMLSLS